MYPDNNRHTRAIVAAILFLTSGIALIAFLGPGSVEKARAEVPGSGTPPLANDVYSNLISEWSITTAAPPPSAQPAVTAAAASNVAVEEYGHRGGTVESAHLVLYSDPDFADAPTEEAVGDENTIPTYMNYLAWLVVIRNATQQVAIPGGPSAVTFTETLAVFVDAESGKEITTVTLANGSA